MRLSPLTSHIRRSVAVNTISQLIGRFLTSGTTFIISLILIRHFGILTYGDFVKITTFVAPFYLLADFGINAVYMQLQAKSNPVTEPRAWISLLILRFFLSISLYVITVAILFFLPRGLKDGYTDVVRMGIFFFAVSIFFQATITTANAIFQKHLQYYFSTFATALGSVISLIAIGLILFLPKELGLFSALVGISLGTLTTAVSSVFFVHKMIALKRFSLDKVFMVELFKTSIPLALTLVFNMIYFRVDTVILTLTRSTAEVGVYGFIYKIFEVALVFPTFFMNALYPVLLSSKVKTQSLGKEFYRLLLRALCVLLGAALLVMGMFILGSQLLPYVHAEFLTGITPFRYLTYSLPFFYLSSLTMWLLITFEKQMHLVFIYGSSMALNFVLNVIYIPQYGIRAAALVTFASEGYVLLLSSYFILKYLYKKQSLHDIRSTFVTHFF